MVCSTKTKLLWGHWDNDDSNKTTSVSSRLHKSRDGLINIAHPLVLTASVQVLSRPLSEDVLHLIFRLSPLSEPEREPTEPDLNPTGFVFCASPAQSYLQELAVVHWEHWAKSNLSFSLNSGSFIEKIIIFKWVEDCPLQTPTCLSTSTREGARDGSRGKGPAVLAEWESIAISGLLLLWNSSCREFTGNCLLLPESQRNENRQKHNPEEVRTKDRVNKLNKTLFSNSFDGTVVQREK